MMHRRTTYMTDAIKKTDRIKSLQDERENRQKNEFTTWINSVLQEEGMKVEDLYRDLSDGRRLTRLLELVFSEKFTRLPRGNFRMHHIENVNKCLTFLRTKVPLPSIGAEDIVDGNHRLILGLIWTIMHGSPTKIEDPKEILSTPLPQVEQTTILHELIKQANQDSVKVQQNTRSVTVEREAVSTPEGEKSLQHTTCDLKVKCDTSVGKEDMVVHQNSSPVKSVKESDDISKAQLLQQKQHETDGQIIAIHQDLIKKKKQEVEEAEEPCLIYQSNVVQLRKQEQQETEPVQDYKNRKQEHYPNENLYELHLSEKEKHDQNGKAEIVALEIEEVGDSQKLRCSNNDKKQDGERNREMELLQNRMEEDLDCLNEMHLTEQKQSPDQSVIVNRYDKEEEDDLKKLLPSELKQQQNHKDEDSEIKQKYIKVDDDSHKIQRQECDEQSQQDNSGDITTPEVCELNKVLPSKLKQQQSYEDEESEINKKNIEVDNERLKIQKQDYVTQSQQDNRIDKISPGSPQVDSNKDEADSNEECESDHDVQSGITSTPFLQELRQEYNRRKLFERQQEAIEKEEQEKRESEFYKLLEQMSKNYVPTEHENEEMRKKLDGEKHKKEQLWKQREVERLQEEADRHRQETERQEKLKYEQEEEERPNQLLTDN